MSSPKPTGRYQFRERLGSGGMGDVYAAMDLKSDPPREVAIKTIRDASDPASLELFKRECSVLKSFTHPNVIEIYETGELNEGGNSKPFFVMARLRGVTLSELIKDSPQHLTVQRTIDIISQVCRGLQAAHEKGLVHRDIKPSNIFVLEDDSVKVIDFGVAHLVSTETIGAKGTLYYMAPEQFEGKPVTAATDVFSLGVVCFEALTRRRPFGGNRSDDIRADIMKHTPPPVSSLNPAVSAALSQVIHAAMAKKPHHRFSSAREFGDCLKKALRNEPIERFEPDKLQLRLSRVEKALEASQFEIADEILGEIEEEGYLHPTVNELRRQVGQALRNRDIRQFLESARRFEVQEEYTLALQKVQDALQLESMNAEALELRSVIEAKRSSQQIGNWLNLARKHLSNCAFEPAREAVSSVLHMLPTDITALQLMSEINRIEQDVVRKREEKERYFDSAVELRRKGDLTAALSRLERVLELDREAPDAVQPERGATFQQVYNEVRSESEAIRNALDEAKKQLEAKDYSKAGDICDGFLEKYPNHALFQALKFDIGERQRQDLSAYIAEVDREVEAEPDLDRKAKLLEQAAAKYPDEAHFKRALIGVNAKRDLINGLVNQAQNLEDRGQYSEAIDKWAMLRSIYQQYPGLDFELDRLHRRFEQQTRSEAKARWIDRIDGAINSGDYARALNLVQQALVESPQDAQLLPLERLTRQRVEQSQRAQDLLEQGQKLLQDGSYDEALQTLDSAYGLDDHNPLIRAIFIEAYLRKASAIMDADLTAAEKLLESAFSLDPTNPRVKSTRVLVADRKRSTAIEQYLSKARELQATNELEPALAEVRKGLAVYSGEARLIQLQTSLEGSIKQSELRRDRGKILDIRKRLEVSKDDSLRGSLFEESLFLANKHPGDEQIQTIASEIGNDVNRRQAVPPPVTEEKVSEPANTDGMVPASPVLESTPPAVSGNPTPFLGRIANSLRLPLIIAVGVVLVVASAVIVKSVGSRRVPPTPKHIVGTASTKSPIAIRKNSNSPEIIGRIDAGQTVELLDQLPPLRLNEWMLVQSESAHVEGWVQLGDLEHIRTDRPEFNVGDALLLISQAADPAELKSRLSSLVHDLETSPLGPSPLADDVFIELSEHYARLARDLTEIDEKNAELDTAEKYLASVQGSELLSARAEKQKELIRSIRESFAPPTTPTPPPPPRLPIGPSIQELLASAKTAYDKKQYAAAVEFSRKVLTREQNNAQATKLLNQALQAQNDLENEILQKSRR